MTPLRAALCLFALAGSASAATIAYQFEGSSNAASVTGTGFSVGTLTENDITSGAVYGGFTSTTGSPASTSIVRAYVPGQIAGAGDPPAAPTSAAVDYLAFTVTPNGGNTLDLSAATFGMRIGSFVSTGAGGTMGLTVQVFYQINGGALTALGSSASVNNPVFSAPGSHTGQAAFNTTADLFDVSETTVAPISLSSIPALSAGDTLTIRVALADNSGSAVALTGSTNVKGVYVDDLTLNGFQAVPEPSVTALLGGLALLGIARRRR